MMGGYRRLSIDAARDESGNHGRDVARGVEIVFAVCDEGGPDGVES